MVITMKKTLALAVTASCVAFGSISGAHALSEKSSVRIPVGNLATGESTTLWISLDDGQMVTGECDENCKDLDFRLYLNGEPVDSDILEDNYPIVAATAGWGTYTLVVEMFYCNAPKCSASIQY